MITIDEKATDRLRRFAHAEGSELVGAARLSRIVGMDVVRMPGGGLALGKSAHDGTWFVLQRRGAALFDESAGGAWRGGRVQGEDGVGFTTEREGSLGEAFVDMIAMPCPVLESGAVVEAAVDGAGAAHDAIEAALCAPRP